MRLPAVQPHAGDLPFLTVRKTGYFSRQLSRRMALPKRFLSRKTILSFANFFRIVCKTGAIG